MWSTEFFFTHIFFKCTLHVYLTALSVTALFSWLSNSSINFKSSDCTVNRPFSKMKAENSNQLKLKTYTSTRKSTFTLVTLQRFSISGVISAEKM